MRIRYSAYRKTQSKNLYQYEAYDSPCCNLLANNARLMEQNLGEIIDNINDSGNVKFKTKYCLNKDSFFLSENKKS